MYFIRWNSFIRQSLTIWFAIGCNCLFSQVKYEREFRVERGEVPSKAMDFVDSIEFSTKIKWYKEAGLSTITYEAKTKHEGARYSIEFSKSGVLEDLEIEIKERDVPPVCYAEVTRYFDSLYVNCRIKKVQVQYTGKSASVLEYLRAGEIGNGLIKRYEIVISAKVEGSFKMFEYLFSENGAFIQKAQITLSPTDNIEY